MLIKIPRSTSCLPLFRSYFIRYVSFHAKYLPRRCKVHLKRTDSGINRAYVRASLGKSWHLKVPLIYGYTRKNEWKWRCVKKIQMKKPNWISSLSLSLCFFSFSFILQRSGPSRSPPFYCPSGTSKEIQ